MADGLGLEAFDRLSGGAVEPARRVVVVIVAEIGADDDQGLGPAPQQIEEFRRLFRRRLAGDERHDGEVGEHGLQERQLHLQAMLLMVGGIEDLHRR